MIPTHSRNIAIDSIQTNCLRIRVDEREKTEITKKKKNRENESKKLIDICHSC